MTNSAKDFRLISIEFDEAVHCQFSKVICGRLTVEIHNIQTWKFVTSNSFRKLLFPTSGNSNNTEHNELGKIDIRLEGYGKTQWRSSKENGGKVQRVEKFVSTCEEVTVLKDLNIGRHELPFVITLGKVGPPSFEGKHGFIRYRVVASKRGGKERLKVPFNLFLCKPFNGLNMAFLQSEEKKVNKLQTSPICVPKGNLSMTVSINRRLIHYEGDVVTINGTFENETPLEAQPLVKLIGQHTFYANGLASEFVRKSVQKWLVTPENADTSPLKPGESRTWTQVTCVLPQVTPSFQSSFIDVDYYLNIELIDTKVSKFQKLFTKCQPLIISFCILVADRLGECDKAKPTPPIKMSNFLIPAPLSVEKSNAFGEFSSQADSDLTEQGGILNRNVRNKMPSISE